MDEIEPPVDPTPASEAPAGPAPEAPIPALPEGVSDALGVALLGIGAMTLPLGLGVAVGWYLGDQGVRWLPSLVGALSLLWIAALLAMIAGSYRLGPGQGRPGGRKRIAALALGVVILAGVRLGVAYLDQPTPLTSLDLPGFRLLFSQDSARYRSLDRTLTAALRTFEAQEGISGAESSPRVLSADEEAAVVDAWGAYVHGALALDEIRRFYEDYNHFDTGRSQRDQHLRSYLLTFAAELALYEHTASLIELVGKNPNVKTFLNVPRPELGLAEDSLAFVRQELAGLTDLSRVVAGKSYLKWLRVTFHAEDEARANGYGWLWDDVQRQLAGVALRSGSELTTLTLQADFAPLKRKLKHLVFPVQKEIAERMGDTKVIRKGRYLITEEQLAEVMTQLTPGDVLLGRKNWYLSNLGLPGFWPHALLYIGDDTQLAATFNQDPTVLEWVRAQGARSFTHYLATRFPHAWAERQAASVDAPLTVIEAVSEGVILHDLGHAAGDYLAALRPRLPLLTKAKAIARAFTYLGRPYDFDFDFATDHALVCSELVWRSYRPASGEPGLEFKTVRVAGREAVPPQEFAKRYAAEAGRAESDRAFDFVLFVDALEGEGRAVVADEAAFRRTASRTKWDVAQR